MVYLPLNFECGHITRFSSYISTERSHAKVSYLETLSTVVIGHLAMIAMMVEVQSMAINNRQQDN